MELRVQFLFFKERGDRKEKVEVEKKGSFDIFAFFSLPKVQRLSPGDASLPHKKARDLPGEEGRQGREW